MTDKPCCSAKQSIQFLESRINAPVFTIEGSDYRIQGRADAVQRLATRADRFTDLLAALEEIEGLSPGGPHISAKAGFEAALAVLGQARTIARAALALANEPADSGDR